MGGPFDEIGLTGNIKFDDALDVAAAYLLENTTYSKVPPSIQNKKATCRCFHIVSGRNT